MDRAGCVIPQHGWARCCRPFTVSGPCRRAQPVLAAQASWCEWMGAGQASKSDRDSPPQVQVQCCPFAGLEIAPEDA